MIWKWWSKLLKKRRQSDRVKMMLFFSVLGMGFLGDFAYRGIIIYQTIKSPTEYVLTSASNVITDVQIAMIGEYDFVRAVSRQQETYVSLKNEGETVSFSCVELSEEYLESVYGVQKTGAMKVFYLNHAAWEQLIGKKDAQEQQLSKDYQNGEKALFELHVEYMLAGEKDAESETGTAKAVLLEEENEDGQACVFCSQVYVKESGSTASSDGADAALSGGNDKVRVQIKQQDLDGMSLNRLNRLGLEVVNAEEIKLEKLAMEIQFLRMKYNALAVVLSLLAVGSLQNCQEKK